MRIGIDASSLIQKKTGIGSFASSFFEALKERAGQHQLFFYRPANQKDLNTPQRIAWEAFSLPSKARRDRVELVYSPGFSPPPFGPFKKVVTVHDVIGLIYPKNVGSASRWYWSQWLPRNLRRADVLVASSESTRNDLEKYLHIPKTSVEVVPLAASPLFRKVHDPNIEGALLKRHSLKKPFLIAVGTLEPRKNALRLVQAFQKISLKIPELSLVLIGKDGGLENAVRQFIRENRLDGRVKLLGYLTDGELVTLYNAAMGYAMVSLYEGFGLPALEAMSCGLTGVVSNVSSLPEVAGDTAYQVDPEDENAISEALARLASDTNRRNVLASKAHERSKSFSYQATAKRMMEIFEKAIT